ncbi:hypothetical protein [Piscinibacter sp.]|uniref:hypothetical protein n=1 Tax=Piscinibacter sp. TaxID=1903157 RepID=UPI002C09F42F|nr:hypothetical protein [Albitalea sp.]HUG26176.1 hypothetical protein [Albitalea sp.]
MSGFPNRVLHALQRPHGPVPLLRRLPWVLVAWLLGGCAAFDGYPQRATDPEADLVQLKPQLEANAITACLDAPSLLCRNRIIGARMYATDIRFSQFEETLFRETRKAGFGATVSTLGLTTAAAASSGGTAQVLSGLTAFIIGGREAFQKEVLAERTVIAIHSAMRTKRAQVALRLRTGLNEPLSRYPLEAALTDLDQYYNAGSVLGAMIDITETMGASAQQAELELKETLSFKPDAFAGRFELAICGGEPNCPNPRAAAFTRVTKCWPEVGVPPETKMVDFILQERFARQRELVAECMGL